MEDFEAYAVVSAKNMLCAARFSVQGGKINGVKTTVAALKDGDEDSINEAYRHVILESFPQDQPVITSKIYVFEEFEDAALVEEILNERHGRKFSISRPKIGEKRKICEIAAKNAEVSIDKYLKTHDDAILELIAEYFSLSHVPYVIEAFDNSHLFGEAAVGAMVRWSHGAWDKDGYRRMHLTAKNDYDQMRQMLTARALRFDKLSPPDLWVIDGGEALLNLALEILASSGANVDVIAISKEKIDAKAHRAKGAAKDKIYTQKGKFTLNADDKKLQFFQRLRDEAHRFAISFHQKSKRKLDLQSSKLLSLGVSKGSLKKLLDFYGDFESIYAASFDEIRSLTNIQTAEKILNDH